MIIQLYHTLDVCQLLLLVLANIFLFTFVSNQYILIIGKEKEINMTDRVFEDARSWEVSDCGGRSVEAYVFDPKTSDRNQGEVMITVTEGVGWDSQRASFTITAEEATRLKEFLTRKGY
jgi:hypothetical protein